MTDTEKLREKLKEVRVFEAYEADYRFLMDEEIDQIFQACKEAGLVFRGKRYNIDLTTVLWGIKEIE